MSQLLPRAALAIGTSGLSEGGGIVPLLQGLQKAVTPSITIPTPPAATTPDAPAVQGAMAARRRSQDTGRGYASTILSRMLPSSPGGLKPTLGS